MALSRIVRARIRLNKQRRGYPAWYWAIHCLHLRVIEKRLSFYHLDIPAHARGALDAIDRLIPFLRLGVGHHQDAAEVTQQLKELKLQLQELDQQIRSGEPNASVYRPDHFGVYVPARFRAASQTTTRPRSSNSSR